MKLKIKVKSMNRYPEMLRFLIKNNYQIVGVEGNDPEKLKVVLEKAKAQQGGAPDAFSAGDL